MTVSDETRDPSIKPDSPAAPTQREPVPRLPRGKGFNLSGPQLVRVAMFAALLAGVIVLRQPCSDGIARFMGQFEPAADAGPAATPSATPPGFVELRGEMTEEELKKKLQQAGIDVAEPEPDTDSQDTGTPGDARPR